MRAVSMHSLLAALPLVSLFLFPLSSLADSDWHSDVFYEKLHVMAGPITTYRYRSPW